jgi:SAM-dependent methyltransferase
MGILGPLSHRVGPQGHVIGVDTDATQLAAARAFVQENHLDNVEILDQDACHTTLPRASFDCIHVRFVFAPVGRDAELLQEMLALTRPGGVVVIQEPDATSWQCYPAHPAWDRLKEAILAAFARGGGDFNAGQPIVDGGILSEVELDSAIAACEQIARDSETVVMSFIVTQVWGRKASH